MLAVQVEHTEVHTAVVVDILDRGIPLPYQLVTNSASPSLQALFLKKWSSRG